MSSFAPIITATTLMLSVLLSGCGGGSTSPLTQDAFGGGNLPPCGSTNSIGCTPDNAGTGGTTTTGLSANNFVQVASKFTEHVDNLNRLQADSPPSLASFSLQLLQKHVDPNKSICIVDPGNPNPTISESPEYTFTIQTCKVQAGANVYIVDGTVTATPTVTPISQYLNSNSIQWSVNADFNSNLTMTLDVTDPNNDLTFNGQYNLTAALDNNLTTTITTTNLDIQDSINATTDTFPDLVITNVTTTTQQQSLTINGSFTSSVTNSTLDASTTGTLVWASNMINPDGDASGQLTIIDGTSNSLSLQPNPGSPMIISLSDGTTSGTSW